MTIYSLLFAAMATTAGAVSAQQDLTDIERLVMQAANAGHTVENALLGRAATAVPFALRDAPGCLGVGVIQNGQGSFRGGPRIDNFRVCGTAIERNDDVSPALPNDRDLQQVGIMAIRGAIRYGQQTSEWRGYEIQAIRLSAADSAGCAQVETIVTNTGMLVSRQAGRLCF